jgi:hypothetical protein
MLHRSIRDGALAQSVATPRFHAPSCSSLKSETVDDFVAAESTLAQQASTSFNRLVPSH